MGRIKSLPREIWNPRGFYAHIKERILKPSLVGTFIKYKYVVLCDNTYRKKVLVHKLVYESFNGILQDGLDIDHKDNNPLNNYIENLEAITTTENILKSVLNSKGKNKKKQHSFKIIDTLNGEEFIFKTAAEVGKYLELSATHVRNTANNIGTTKLLKGRYQAYAIDLITYRQ